MKVSIYECKNGLWLITDYGVDINTFPQEVISLLKPGGMEKASEINVGEKKVIALRDPEKVIKDIEQLGYHITPGRIESTESFGGWPDLDRH